MSSIPPPRFRKGEVVVLRSTLEIGRVEEDPVLDAGEYWYRVQLQRRVQSFVEEDLDVLDEADRSLEELAKHGRWGRLSAFRRALAVERIRHTNRSTVYSFNAQRIQFEPYQYKPLLKILDSPDRRLLIADEVGLGKTIEAGLVLAELEARQPLEKVLVVCPSRLRDKWREEMNRKFNQDFTILDRGTLLEYLNRAAENPTKRRLRGIISMQTIRSPDLRDTIAATVDYIDVVIIDEAHHARNPWTQTSEMLGEMAQIGDAVLLLTATPLHLGSRDLYTLLNALRPAEFRDADVFEAELQHHRGVLRAGNAVRSRDADALPLAAGLLREVFLEGRLAAFQDPLALQVIEEMGDEPPRDRRGWVELERKVQDLHPLSTVVTRTRKKDVVEHAPTRRAYVLRCPWTEEEHETYLRLVNGEAHGGWFRQPLSLGQIQRARQAASCLPAAVESHSARVARDDDEAVELTDLLPGDLPPGILADDRPETILLVPYSGPDTKFAKLLEILREVWGEEPEAKILIFTFFVGTSKYLTKHLTEVGYPTLRIAGDVRSDPLRPLRDERGQIVSEFRENPQFQVMVSTEVGSEGLDFQFCHHIVNYDLPWNPMVVEQRIGRIDRFGQESEIVHIHNLVVEGTVEDRILFRLYQRIGIFQKSIGDLDAILGETVRQLQKDYVSGRLTETEAERRVEEAAQAIERRRIYYEEVEQKASELFGHEEFIRSEMERVRRLGRFISERSLLAVLSGYFQARHPRVKIFDVEPGIHGLRLTDELRWEIQAACKADQVWVDRSEDGVLQFTTDGQIAFRWPRVELINVSHPLLRAAVKALEELLAEPTARVGQAVVSGDGDEDVEAGTYVIAVFAHQVEGLRGRRVLEPIAYSTERSEVLEPEAGEHLLHLASEVGDEWDEEQPGPPVSREAWSRMVSEARRRNRAIREKEARENEARYVRRRRALEADFDHRRNSIEGKLRTARERGRDETVLRLFRAQLDKARARYEASLEVLEKGREVRTRLDDPIAVCLVCMRRE